MERALRWKTIALIALVALSIVYLVPTFSPRGLPPWFARIFTNKVQLGLDLQGGLHIVYGVDLDKAVDDKAGELKREFEAKLEELKLTATIETPRTPLGAVYMIFPDAAGKAKVDAKFLADYEEILARMDCPADKAETGVCLRVSSDYADRIKESALDQAVGTIKDRVDRYGVAEPTIIKKGDDIVVELPGLNDQEIERLKSLIDRTAQLEFKIVDDGSQYMQKLAAKVAADKPAEISFDSDGWVNEESGERHTDFFLVAKDKTVFLPEAEAQKYGCVRESERTADNKFKCLIRGRTVIQEYLTSLPPDHQPDEAHQLAFEEVTPRDPLTAGKNPEKSWRTYYLFRSAELTGAAVSAADVTWNPTTNRPEVLLSFNRYGTRRFGELTSKNVGEKMAIILDGLVNSAPTIQTAITGGKSTITMGTSDPRIAQVEAQDLVNVLRTGSLPAPLREMSSSRVGPLLGQDAIDKTKSSMAVGAGLVVVIMIYFFKFSGVIATVAMALNIVLQIAVLAAFQATLTLPGIAGLVLTIGMAVDSNIIIYERIREELRSGKSVRGAVDAGFGHAFWTVFDAHVTNFIAGFVLLEFGTGPIRGFAVMLIIGVVCNLFTSTWASRLMFDHYVGRRKATTALSI